MLKKITTTTASAGLGFSQARNLLRVSGGSYDGRLAALIQTSPGNIQLFWADHPYTGWSNGLSVVTDAADVEFDATIDSVGNIYLVYSEQTTNVLVMRKLTFSGGSWTAGAKRTIYNANKAFEPSIVIEPFGKLWVSFSRFITPNRNVQVKSSVDDGLTWGAGPADEGDVLAGAGTTTYSKLLIGALDIFAVTAVSSNSLIMESRPISGGGWSSPFTIVSGVSVAFNFDAAISSDGRLAVVYSDGQLKYREYDGSSWSGIITVASIGDEPQLLNRGNIPIIVYFALTEGAQRRIEFVERLDGNWSSPVSLDNRADFLWALLLFDSVSATFETLTAAAASSASGDIFHSVSGGLFKLAGDKMYAGNSAPFRYLQTLLSTVGTGGTVSYSYWDGSGWISFTPDNGLSHFTGSINRVIFWTDYQSIPGAWQKNSVNGVSAFWLKIEVTSDFTTPPVGSFITAISELQNLQARR